MVASYTQLLARRYQGRLDADADDFIHYAVDGAQRMQRLINDLLAYSRVTTRGVEQVPLPLDRALDQALTNLQFALEETGARVEREPLPPVLGDEGQLAQLLQNLLGNALKFRGDDPPVLTVTTRASDEPELVTVVVRDNGIGIDPRYHERIFEVFQRLHTAAEYPGTGIGLSVCKKVVERHGGRLWVESRVGEGAAFCFTLRRAGGA